MNDERLNRELDEMLAMLKQAEHSAIVNGHIYEVKDIAAIHMAVLHGYYDMSEALEFIRAMYGEDGDSDDEP